MKKPIFVGYFSDVYLRLGAGAWAPTGGMNVCLCNRNSGLSQETPYCLETQQSCHVMRAHGKEAARSQKKGL